MIRYEAKPVYTLVIMPWMIKLSGFGEGATAEMGFDQLIDSRVGGVQVGVVLAVLVCVEDTTVAGPVCRWKRVWGQMVSAGAVVVVSRWQVNAGPLRGQLEQWPERPVPFVAGCCEADSVTLRLRWRA